MCSFSANAQTIRSHTKNGHFSSSRRCLLSASSSFFHNTFLQQRQKHQPKAIHSVFVVIKSNFLLTCTIAVSTEDFSSWWSQHGTRYRWRRRHSFRCVMGIGGSRWNWTEQDTTCTRLFIRWGWINNNWLTRSRRARDYSWSCCDRKWCRLIHLQKTENSRSNFICWNTKKENFSS